MQKILGYIRKAIDEYNMIEDGDKIAVALSGGKDSTTMLMGLKNLQRFYPKKFEIIGITINPGFDFFNSTILKDLCDNLDVPFFEEFSHTKEIVFDRRYSGSLGWGNLAFTACSVGIVSIGGSRS